MVRLRNQRTPLAHTLPLSIITQNNRFTVTVLPVEKCKTEADFLYVLLIVPVSCFKIQILCSYKYLYSIDGTVQYKASFPLIRRI
jgi:hypothetical protein